MSTSVDQPSSSEVASEAEGTRATLARTLDQLRDNLKPENVVDEVFHNAKIGASTVADTVWGVAKEHPIPALLIAGGAAMILGLGTRSGAKARPEPTYPGGAAGLPRPRQLRNPTLFDSVRKGAASVVGTVGAARNYAAGAASTTAQALSGVGQQASTTFGDGAMTRKSSQKRAMTPVTGTRVYRMSFSTDTLFKEQPLILGAIGVAIGAAIGAALPVTETEDAWMGSTSHSLKEAAQGIAHEQVEGLKTAASRAVENVKNSVAEHGLSTDNLTGLVREVGDHAKTAVQDVGSTLRASDKPA